MLEATIEVVLLVAAAHVAAGVIASIFLHARGLKRIDPAVPGSGLWFRLLITPGLVALWPWMLWRWRRAPAPSPFHRPLSAAALRRLHRVLAWVLAIVLPLLFLAGIVLRPGQ